MVCLDGGWHCAAVVVENNLGQLLVNCSELLSSISSDRAVCVKEIGRGGGEGDGIRCSWGFDGRRSGS